MISFPNDIVGGTESERLEAVSFRKIGTCFNCQRWLLAKIRNWL